MFDLETFMGLLTPAEARDLFYNKMPTQKHVTSSSFKVIERPGDALKCKYCGGNIDSESGICPFCDTQYKIEKPTPKAVLYADDKIVEEIY